MLKTKNKLIIVLALAWSLIVTPSIADINVGEGYSKTSFKELYQTMTVMGGIDIDNPKMLKEYIKLNYCDLYKEHYLNDIKWHEISSKVYSDIIDRRENYRIMYEFTELIKLDRYNFDKEYFDINKKSKMKNVGTVLLLNYREFQPYCFTEDEKYLFPKTVVLLLTTPLNMTKLEVPQDRIKELLSTIEHTNEQGLKAVYARIRFRVLDTPGLIYEEGNKKQASKAAIRGNIEAIDFFYDRELTKAIDVIKIAQE